MKLNLKFMYLFVFLLMGLTFSCQDEVIEETPTNDQETIVPNSNLANLMRSTVILDGSIDNIIDSANCILVDLPVTLVVNGITITIQSVDDYDVIEAIWDQFINDEDEVEIQFPIVIILSDYTEVTIENQEELESYIEDCFGENEDDDDIECIDFQYPFSISIYDSNFQVIETVEINSDVELYYFIEDLEGGVLASINFPINMVLANGEVIQVNNNTELEAAIAGAEDDCDEDDDNDYDDDDECDMDIDFVEGWLYECPIEATVYDANGDIIDVNQLDFMQNNEVVVNGTPTVTEVGIWTLNETNSDYVLSITELNTFNLIEGDWALMSCENNYLIFTQDTGSGIITMVFEMDCNSNTGSLGCLEGNEIVICDENNDGYEVFNLYEGLSPIDGCTINNAVAVSFHTSLVDAQSNANPILGATSFTNTSSAQTIYVRVEVISNPTDFEILEIDLFLEDCSNGPLSCLEANDIELCDENNDGYEVFNLYDGLSEIDGCTTNNTVAVSFHTSLTDAESNLNSIASATSFTNTSNPQTVYVRIELFNTPSEFEILEIGLYLEDCSGGNCTEQEINSYLVECTWNVVQYNSSNDLIEFDLVFGANGMLTVTGDGQTITINDGWSTSSGTTGTVLTLSNIALGQIQAITGEWTIVECNFERLEMVRGNDIMVIEQSC